MNKIAVAVALTLLPVYAMGASMTGSFGQTQNLIGIYGQVVGTPSSVSASDPSASASASGGNTVGGVGVFANGVNSDLWFMHLGFNYAAGAAISGGSGTVNNNNASSSTSVNGHSLQFNARLGKLFAVTPVVAVGPYLAYQYADSKLGVNGFGNVTYGNNALGGGVELVTNTGGPFDVDAHIGYLAGVDATASANTIDGSGSFSNPPSSGVVQLGAKGVYAFTPQFSAFAGIAYDRYHTSYNYPLEAVSASATINEVRGMVGLAYNFG